MPATDATRPIPETLKEYGRGIVGGLIFAFAPLYTMEVWWQAFIAQPRVVLIALPLTFVVLIAYSYYAGLREDQSIRSNALEALETLALGFLVAFVVLTLLGQLSSSLSPRVYVLLLTIEAMTCAIGVAVGSTQLGDDPDEEEPASETGVLHELAYSILGAIIIVSGFTPTAEVMVTSLEAPPWAPAGVAVLSFVLALGIVSYISFNGTGRLKDGTYAGGPIGDAFVTYAIAILVSAALLWGVGRFEGMGAGACVFMTVYLAWPATLGASAGRFLL